MTTQTWTSLVRRDTKGPLSTGAIAGIAVGAAVLFFASAALFVVYYRRQRRYNAEDSEYYQYADSVQRGQNNTGRTFVAVPRRAPTYTLDYKMDNQVGTGQSTPAQFSADPRAQIPESPPLDDMASAMPTHPAYLPKAVVRGTTLKPITRRPSEDNSTPAYYTSNADSSNMPMQAYRGSSSTATAVVTGGSDSRMMGSKEKQFFPSPPGSGGTGATTFYDDEDYYAEDPEKDVKGRRRVSLPLRLAPVDQEEENEDHHYYQQQQKQEEEQSQHNYQQAHRYHPQHQHQQQQQQNQPQPPQQSPPALPTPASVASSRTTQSGAVPTISLPIKGKKKRFPPPQLNLQQNSQTSPNNPNPNQITDSGSNLRNGSGSNLRTDGSGGTSSGGGLMVDMVMSTSNHRPLSGMEDMSISGPLAFPHYSHQQYAQQQLQQLQEVQGGYYVDQYGQPVAVQVVPGNGGSRSGGGGGGRRGNRDRSRSFGGDHHQGQGHGVETGRREKRHSGNNGRHYEEVEIGREADIW
ncbi:hypothetical protein QBC32DRAFT_211713 [Pseudoneurospora amorphoporcata]|uniref:Uncharacterized protein n=1 Tax=Pseudoneurospora amorphoporcata TaxID=241081 RepID=A0AAN6SGX7_9PEZI|nr:hypothetical protein QBC32DRAFT_211713 [Pseudoneurospora amorphoporcata]